MQGQAGLPILVWLMSLAAEPALAPGSLGQQSKGRAGEQRASSRMGASSAGQSRPILPETWALRHLIRATPPGHTWCHCLPRASLWFWGGRSSENGACPTFLHTVPACPLHPFPPTHNPPNPTWPRQLRAQQGLKRPILGSRDRKLQGSGSETLHLAARS